MPVKLRHDEPASRSHASRPGAFAAPGRLWKRVRPPPAVPGARRSGVSGTRALPRRRDVLVPATVGAFAVLKVKRVFELAVVVLDLPAHLPEAHELAEIGVGGEVGEPGLTGARPPILSLLALHVLGRRRSCRP